MKRGATVHGAKQRPRPRLPWVLVSLPVALCLAGLLGCAGQYIAGGGPIWSSGDIGGSQKSGTGGGYELGYFHLGQRSALGAVLSGNHSGYSGGGDADPVVWAELDAVYRRFLASSASGLRPFAGGGVGAGVSLHDGAVAALFLAIGGRVRAGRRVGLSFSLRERPAVFMRGGRARSRFNNSVQLGITADFLLGDAAAAPGSR